MNIKDDSKKIIVDDVEYILDEISDEARTQLMNIQFVDEELQRINNEWAVTDTARIGYTNALKNEIANKDSTKDQRTVGNSFKIDDTEYDIENISPEALSIYRMVEMCTTLLDEKQKTLLYFQNAKNSTIETLKKQVVAEKAGLLFDEEQKDFNMPTINLDGIEYNTEDLSTNGKAQVASLQFINFQLKKLSSQIQIYNVARTSYVSALKNALEASDTDTSEATSE